LQIKETKVEAFENLKFFQILGRHQSSEGATTTIGLDQRRYLSRRISHVQGAVEEHIEKGWI
jgi:hypothetical protein